MFKNFCALFLLLSFSTTLTAQNAAFAVEVAAFAEPVSDGHFKEIRNVYETLDANYIYRYYIYMNTKTEAVQKKEEVQKLGFKNVRIIDFEERKALCNVTCQYVQPAQTGKKITSFQSQTKKYGITESLRCIFFDFDQSFIRDDAKIELDKLLDVLHRNDNYQLEIMAHTDARGSLEYNKALSKRRSLATERYLIDNGIHSSRITKTLFGESDPIALNELSSGEDTELGRQFNRRVEFKILNEYGNTLGVIDKIRVPEKVKNN